MNCRLQGAIFVAILAMQSPQITVASVERSLSTSASPKQVVLRPHDLPAGMKKMTFIVKNAQAVSASFFATHNSHVAIPVSDLEQHGFKAGYFLDLVRQGKSGGLTNLDLVQTLVVSFNSAEGAHWAYDLIATSIHADAAQYLTVGYPLDFREALGIGDERIAYGLKTDVAPYSEVVIRRGVYIADLYVDSRDDPHIAAALKIAKAQDRKMKRSS